jgi:hypothetical protein
MGDINNDNGVAAGATFPDAMYVLFLFYLVLQLVPCLDRMHVLNLMYVVKYACASIMLFSVINLKQKLSNNLTLLCAPTQRNLGKTRVRRHLVFCSLCCKVKVLYDTPIYASLLFLIICVESLIKARRKERGTSMQ